MPGELASKAHVNVNPETAYQSAVSRQGDGTSERCIRVARQSILRVVGSLRDLQHPDFGEIE